METTTLNSVLAYLDGREAALTKLIKRQPQHEATHRARLREIRVVRDDLQAGMHLSGEGA